MKTNQEIIKEEIDSILEDIIKVYNSSGRKVTGQFEEGLEAVYENTNTYYKGTIKGFVYLAGRGKTKKKGKAGEPTVLQQITEWIKNKGIAAKALAAAKPKTAKGKINFISGLAYAITKKIHEQGTNRSEWLKIYEEVITPERVESIIEKISVLNVNLIITEVKAELEILQKNV